MRITNPSNFKKMAGGRAPMTALDNGHVIKRVGAQESRFNFFKPHFLRGKTACVCIIRDERGTRLTREACEVCKADFRAGKYHGITGCFLVMQDITHGMENVRVLDVKIGTRQHGDYVALKKQKKQISKYMRSTSYKYGLRMGGLFSIDSIKRNGGNAFGYKQLVDKITHFFGKNKKLYEQAILRLKKMIATLKTLDTLRLFGASLLIAINEAEVPVKDKIVIVLVDFAKATHADILANKIIHNGVDAGAILGLQNMIDILEKNKSWADQPYTAPF